MSTEPANIKYTGELQPEVPQAVVDTPETNVEAQVESTQDEPQVQPEVTETQTDVVTDETPQPEAVAEPQKTETPIVSKTKEDILAELGVSEEEILEMKKSKEAKAEPPQEEKAFAELVNYAIQNGKSTKDEILQFENIQKADIHSLVYNKFAEAKRAEDSSISDEDIKSDFDFEYYVDSDDAKLKKIGEGMIAAEAESIKKPLVDKIEAIKKDFVIASNLDGFKKQQDVIVNEFAKHPIKKSIQVNGENVEIEVMPKITFDELKKHLAETEEGKIQNNLLFDAYVNNPEFSEKALGKMLTAMAEQKAETEIYSELVKKTWEKAEAHFKDTAIGAKAPFKSKEDATLARNTGSVDETKQWREYKNKNY